MKVVIIAGTRPEAIKLAPVVMELRRRAAETRLDVRLCASGQHLQMLRQAFADFDLTPDEDLAVMQPSQSLAGLSASLFQAIDPFLAYERPEWLLVQGDTTTVMVAALCAFYRGIKVGHVEAGLRSYRKDAPFPEEINRRVAGVVADLHFAPTVKSRDNLLREGVKAADVLVTGNTVIDALLWMRERVRGESGLLPPQVVQALERGQKIVLVTGHRRENFGQAMEDICRAIKTLADRREDAFFVYPVHLNPNVQGPVKALLSNHPRVALLPPMSYKPFVALLDACALVLTDSGGLQEEAPALGKPVLVMRDVTERPEGVEAGVARLVGSDPRTIVAATEKLLSDAQARQAMTRAANPYGDGFAARRIVDAIFARKRMAHEEMIRELVA